MASPTRVLGLHGSEGTGDSFRQVLAQWSNDWEIVTIDGPHEKGMGYAWWNMPPYVRSFNATEYDGYEASREAVLEAWTRPDLVVGHSQGAILLTALLANEEIAQHPRLGYVLNGVAWPNPYTTQLEALQPASSLQQITRVLILVGDQDAINPPAQAQRVTAALRNAGYDVTVLSHPGGHGVPTREGPTKDAILEWIDRGIS